MKRKQFFALVVIPAAIAAGIGIVFFLANFGIFFHHSNEEYVERLKSGNKDIRWHAALQLGVNEYEPAIPALKEALEDPAQEVRYHAALALANLEAREAIPALVAMLKDEKEELRIRIVAIEALMQLGGEEVQKPLLDQARMPETRWEVRQASVRAIGELRIQEGAPILKERLGDMKDEVRWNAALALSKFQDPAALPVLHAMLEEPREEVVANALAGIRLIGDPSSLDPLRKLKGRVKGLPLEKKTRIVIQEIESRHQS